MLTKLCAYIYYTHTDTHTHTDAQTHTHGCTDTHTHTHTNTKTPLDQTILIFGVANNKGATTKLMMMANY